MNLTKRTINHRRNRKTSERVAADIIKDITDRGLSPGTRLPPEHEMVEIFNVSRMSLREGLRILEINGLVTLRAGPNGGPIVGSAEPEHFARAMTMFFEMRGTTFQDLMQALITIEPVMARLAANRVAQGDVSELQELHEALEAHANLDPKNLTDYSNLCENFHRIVAGLSGNSILDMFGVGLCEIIREPARTEPRPATRWTQVRAEHAAVGQAIIDGNGARAETLMTDHMHKFSKSFSRRYGPLIKSKLGWL